MDGAALDRPRPHQRHLHRQVIQVPGQRPREHLHLRPAFDLEDAGGLRPLDRAPHPIVVQRHPGEIDPLAPRPFDLVHAALDR
jgi:hypothetical protein